MIIFITHVYKMQLISEWLSACNSTITVRCCKKNYRLCTSHWVYVLVGQDHYSAGKDIHTQDTAAVSTALLGAFRQDNRTRSDGHQDVDEVESEAE